VPSGQPRSRDFRSAYEFPLNRIDRSNFQRGRTIRSGLREAGFWYVQNRARIVLHESGRPNDDLYNRSLRRVRHDDGLRVNGLCATTARDAGWWTSAITASRLLVASTWLRPDQARNARDAERQQANDDGERESPHRPRIVPSTWRRSRRGTSMVGFVDVIEGRPGAMF
jgi:hypothetical protein